MRTHGWRGMPPRDDEEARQRIIGAMIRCVDRHGPRRTSLTQVAEDLGVTRATVYRYFGNLEELMKAAALATAAEFEARMIADVAHLTDPGDIVVEVFASAMERLPAEPYVGILLIVGSDNLGANILAPDSIEEMANFLARLNIDWAAIGYDAHELGCLSELLMRLLYSYVGVPEATHGDPRPFLRRWLTPALRGSAGSVPAHCL
jgi:AcrR family transcriptional regulator